MAMSVAAQFKGWTKPGPIPPGALGEGPEVEPGESLDAISGHFRLFQAVEACGVLRRLASFCFACHMLVLFPGGLEVV